MTDRRFSVIPLAFASGAAALIYEIVWFQLLELVIGSSAVSLSVILATFMGGTCLGSLLFPRLVSTHRNPLRVYAAIEIGIAVLALIVLLVSPAVGRVYTAWAGFGLQSFLLRGAIAVVCLLPPTLLMGATLPALGRLVEPTPKGVSWAGLFYGGNIAGAVFGCMLAAFYLLREYDVTTATLVAATVNAVVAAAAVALAPWVRRDNLSERQDDAESSAENSGLHGSTVYAAIAVSGFCALAGEVIWTRILGLLLGASVYTFSIILSVFLAGLGIGSALGSLLSRTVARPRAALGWCQVLAAGAVGWTAYTLSASLPYWPVNPSLSSDIWFNFQFDLNRAFWALLPPTLLWGASFPLALAALAPKAKDAARLIAGVYAANTVGAIAGAVGASLLLVPWLGSQRAQQLLIALSVGAGLMLLLPASKGFRWSKAGLAFGALSAGALLVYSVPPLSDLLVAHGRFAATWVGKSEILFAKEGLHSSVAVSRFPNGALTYHVAGKIQASNVPRDMRLQRMLGHLTTLTAADPRSVLVIGCGAGVTAGAVAVDPAVERLTLVEIEPIVPEASAAYFSEHNFNVLQNPKVDLHIDDGRHYVFTTDRRFDAITADPLDPWVKGAANLYTKEFLEAARARLNPGGALTMYMQLFETNLDAVKSAVATFFEVFPNGTVWGNTHEGQGHDMVLLGTVEPLRIDLDRIQQRLDLPEYAVMARSLAEVDMPTAVDLFATYAGRGSDLRTWVTGAAINRDRNLRMQYLAGTGLNLDESPAIYASMLAYRRFPNGLFTSAEGRVDELWRRIQGVASQVPGQP